jgi:signal transduction histidine kinase
MTGGLRFCNVSGVSGSGQPVASPQPPFLHRVTFLQLWTIDIVLATLIALKTGVQAAHAQRQDPVAIVVSGLLLSTSIAFRRRVALPSLGLAILAVLITTATGLNDALTALAVALPAFQVAVTYGRHRSIPVGLLTAAALFAMAAGVHFGRIVRPPSHVATGTAHGTQGLPLLAAVAMTAAWFVGDSVRVRRVYVAGLAEQALQRQREAIERAQRSVAEERLQIARELHDVVAHSLSVIAVQSGVGRHVIDDQPDEAKKALSAIETTSRSALVELRRMLGVLRRDDRLPAELAPAPGIASLDPLLDQVRAAGYAVNLEAAALSKRQLPATVELSIYRIVQEALTNVVRHAGPATVDVRVREEADALVVEVRDDGRGAATAGPDAMAAEASTSEATAGHHGIVGMRERVAMFDGSLSARPLREGGFLVEARFPHSCLTSP